MKRRRNSRAAALGALCAFCLAAAALAADHLLARPRLSGFDPAGMARSEAAMWRAYYEGRWLRLGWQSLLAAREQFGFSLIDSARLAWHAARAARFFRPATNDPRILPELEAYYAVIARSAAPRLFDIKEAARLELRWWQERRARPAARPYSETVAELAALLYGVPAGRVAGPAAARTGAMDYRDARRDGRMTEADWEEVRRQLETAYTGLKAAVSKADADQPARSASQARFFPGDKNAVLESGPGAEDLLLNRERERRGDRAVRPAAKPGGEPD